MAESTCVNCGQETNSDSGHWDLIEGWTCRKPQLIWDLVTEIFTDPANRGLTNRELLTLMLAKVDNPQRFASDAIHYYESREGPYDHLIETAIFLGYMHWNGSYYAAGKKGARNEIV